MSNEEFKKSSFSNRSIEDLRKAINDDIWYQSAANISIAEYLNINQRRKLEKAIYTLKYEDVPLYILENENNESGKNDETLFSYSLNYYQAIYMNSNFPFGYREEEFNIHKKIMMRRYHDIKNHVLIPPNFKEPSPSGLEEMMQYLDSRKFASQDRKPTVKGKTLILPKVQIERAESPNLEEMIRYTFVNKFENVEVPISYLLKHNYYDDNFGYGFMSIYIILTYLKQLCMEGYEKITKNLAEYEIICFNIWMIPLRDKYIEEFMIFLIAFQKGHPHIYIKDISGRGYNSYKKFSFYNDLKESRIDISVIR